MRDFKINTQYYTDQAEIKTNRNKFVKCHHANVEKLMDIFSLKLNE